MYLKGAKVRFESPNYRTYLLVVEMQLNVAFWWAWRRLPLSRRFCKITLHKTQLSQTLGFHTNPLLPLKYQSIL